MSNDTEPTGISEGSSGGRLADGVDELPCLDEQIETVAGGPDVLPEGYVLSDGEASIVVGKVLSTGALRQYAGTTNDGHPVTILESTDETASAQLERICSVVAAVKSSMLPGIRYRQENGNTRYVALSQPSGPTLAEVMSSQLPFPRLVNTLAQVASCLSAMHETGWLHLGVRPDKIIVSKPVCLQGLEYVCAVGGKPDSPFYIAGYSAPELILEQAMDPRADIYSLGAILYHAVTGKPIAEAGPELLGWQPPSPFAGVPQVLSRCLGTPDTRFSSMSSLHSSLLHLAKHIAPKVSYSLAGDTTIGLEPSRTTNQDTYGFMNGKSESDEGSCAWAVLCVADGMGGMTAGDVASQAAVRAVFEAAAATLAGSPELTADSQCAATKQWAVSANERVCRALEERGARGGTTLVCACVLNRRLTIAHVGDCRIYLIRDGDILALTQDHSLAMALVLQDEIKMDQVRDHPDRNRVTRSLGDRNPLPEYYVDTLQQTQERNSMELRPGDILLLCSDGLWEPVLESAMVEVLNKCSGRLGEAASRMVTLALEHGAPDNATVALLGVEEILVAKEG